MLTLDRIKDVADARSRKRRRDAKRGRVAESFDLAWMYKYLPHYMTVKPSRFHKELIADLGRLHRLRGQKHVRRGPRESGKSTYLSKGYPLYCALEGIEPLTLLLADSDKQVQEYLSSIKTELESNEAIRHGYPHAAGVGAAWTIDHIKTRNGMVIKTKGASGKMLGMTSGNLRPTLVIGDDLNARSDAYSPTVRTRRLHWFNTDVLNIGTLGHTNFLVAGTSIHRDAVACVLSRTAGWAAKSYRSIIEWPTATDLWHEWEKIYGNLADEDRDANADAFYAANRAAMDAGAVLLWPEKEPLLLLMKLRAASGPSAFASEKQDEPGTEGSTEFPSEWFENPGMFFDAWPGGLKVKVVSCDPSKGSDARAGDYQAIASVALHADGVFYVDMSLKREPVPVMAERFVQVAKDFGTIDRLAIETNATLGLLLPEIERAMKLGSMVAPLSGVHNTLSKLARVRRLGGWLSRGQIRVRNTPGGKELVEQLRQFPSGEFDDGPDALEIGIRCIEELITGAKR